MFRWGSFYAVLVWLLGQDLPSLEASPLTSQVFAVAVVLLGLVSFALVLALVEQVRAHTWVLLWFLAQDCRHWTLQVACLLVWVIGVDNNTNLHMV